MKLILENWRKYLNEAKWHIRPKIEKQIQNLLALPSDIIIVIEEEEPNWYSIEYASRSSHQGPIGAIEIVAASEDDYSGQGQCLDGYIVMSSVASRGWGPLLYEVAIEFTSIISNGLAPDRGSVSKMATDVWDKYAKRSDVTKKQLDVVHGKKRLHKQKIDVDFHDGDSAYRSQNDMEQLTPGYEFDDCDQRMALKHAGTKWAEAPHSKLYSKRDMPVMKLLKAAKRLRIKRYQD